MDRIAQDGSDAHLERYRQVEVAVPRNRNSVQPVAYSHNMRGFGQPNDRELRALSLENSKYNGETHHGFYDSRIVREVYIINIHLCFGQESGRQRGKDVPGQ